MPQGIQAAADASGPTSHTQLHDDGPDFEDAVRAAEKARIAITGPAGSGKTYTALSIATGLLTGNGTLGVIDTERGSASKYAGLFTFKTLKPASFEPQSVIWQLAKAADRGIDVLVIDTLSPYWSGRGGALAQVDQKTLATNSQSKNLSGWREITPVQMDMLDAILSYPGHVICTMRVKTEWDLQENQSGKREPVKLGTKVDQRDGIDYEFDLVGALNQQHVLTIDKSRYLPIQVGSTFDKPDDTFGHTIMQWLDGGAPNALGVMDFHQMAIRPEMTPQQLLDLHADVERRGLLGAAVFDLARQGMSLRALIRLMGAAARVRDPETGPEGLRALRRRLEQSRRLGALVPGFDGQPTELGDLITLAQTKAREQASVPPNNAGSEA